MHRRDLKPGDRVLIRFPYEGGSTNATIMRMHSDDVRILVQCDPGTRHANGGRPIHVMPRQVVRKATADER